MSFFEEFSVGERWRHGRGTTIGEVESQLLTKLVLNTAQAHFNQEAMTGSPLGDGRLVFGLITGSVVIGLATQDTAEQAIAELGLTDVRFTAPVHLGDTLFALTEVEALDPADRDDAGVVRFRHWGINQHDDVVFEGVRTVLVKRRSHWDRP